MTDRATNLGECVGLDSLRLSDGETMAIVESVATEVPLTIVANGIELATLLCSPNNIHELAIGYLYTSGIINRRSEVLEYYCDTTRWVISLVLQRTPDPELLRKRLYTTSCGKCAMYASINEINLRTPLLNALTIPREKVFELISLLDSGSQLFQTTGGVHTAMIIVLETNQVIRMDDVARHNALDKAIGKALLEDIPLTRCIVVRTGRTSSEIVYKVKKCGMPIIISRGAPTHQAVHLGMELGITITGFARGRSINVYAHPEKITF